MTKREMIIAKTLDLLKARLNEYVPESILESELYSGAKEATKDLLGVLE